MRILFQYFKGSGGALSNVALLLNALAKEFPDDHIDIVCSSYTDFSILRNLKNVQFHSYGSGFNKEIDRLFLGMGGVKNMARQLKADIIWSLNLGSYVKTAIPHILSVHNSYQVYPWKAVRFHPDSYFAVFFLRFFFRRSLRVSDNVLVQTPLMGELVKRIPGAPSKITVAAKAVEGLNEVKSESLPSEIDLILESGLGKAAFTFLYVSTFFPHKNHAVLVKAFEVLAHHNPRNVRLLLTINESELVRLGGDNARALIKSGHILPLGWMDKRYLKSLYEVSDACLMPSILESLSSAHLEAMHWGKPLVVSDVPYARDLCGDAAIYAEWDNPYEWISGMKKLMNDFNLRQKLIDSGHKRMKMFPATWADAAKKIHKVLEEAAALK